MSDTPAPEPSVVEETDGPKANIPARFASFLTGDKDSWQEQVDALATLREQADAAPAPSVPRDPAVDADLETEDDGLSEALGFFGLADQ